MDEVESFVSAKAIMFRHLLIPIAALILVASVNGDTIDHGDLESPVLVFSNITEVTDVGSVSLYGSPGISGNTLAFDSLAFSASALAGEQEFVDGRIIFDVSAKGNKQFTGITLSEFGQMTSQGTDVDVSVSAVVFAIAGGTIYQGQFATASQVAVDGMWQNSVDIQFAQPVSSFSLVANNQLFSRAGAGSSAFVDKQNVSLAVTAVPEPSMATILALGSMLLLRRKR